MMNWGIEMRRLLESSSETNFGGLGSMETLETTLRIAMVASIHKGCRNIVPFSALRPLSYLRHPLWILPDS